jgi:hypothetical protein
VIIGQKHQGFACNISMQHAVERKWTRLLVLLSSTQRWAGLESGGDESVSLLEHVTKGVIYLRIGKTRYRPNPRSL